MGKFLLKKSWESVIFQLRIHEKIFLSEILICNSLFVFFSTFFLISSYISTLHNLPSANYWFSLWEKNNWWLLILNTFFLFTISRLFGSLGFSKCYSLWKIFTHVKQKFLTLREIFVLKGNIFVSRRLTIFSSRDLSQWKNKS